MKQGKGRIILVAAVARNGIIGKDNALPWHIPEDLKRFKTFTLNQNLLMGRKTHDSIVAKIGTPLPKRVSIILTRQTVPLRNLGAGCAVVKSIDDALAYSYRDLYVIGGEEIYRLALPFADELWITLIDKDFEGDAFFPEIDKKIWKVTKKEKGAECEKVGFEYWFMTHTRIKPR